RGLGLREEKSALAVEPVEVSAKKLEIGADLAERIERVGVEIFRRSVGQRFGMALESCCVGGNGIALRPAPQMVHQKTQRCGCPVASRLRYVELHEFRIGKQRQTASRHIAPLAENAVIVVTLQRKIAVIVEVMHATVRGIERIDAYARLGMAGAVGNSFRVGKIKGIHLDQRQPAALDLGKNVRLQPVEHGKFLYVQPHQQLQVRGGKLEKGE